jgi:hypothetical protein
MEVQGERPRHACAHLVGYEGGNELKKFAKYNNAIGGLMPMDCKAYVCVTIISTTIPGNMISPYNSHRWKYQQ